MLTCCRTTETPVLAPTHPLRTAFTRYGTWAARHVKTVLPLSGAVVFISIYLFSILYTTDVTNFTSGASNLPHHVWTDAQPLGEGEGVEPDVIMRSIWVHGSYMKALERDTLLGALELQDELLGPTTDFNPRQPAHAPAQPDPTGADLDRLQRDSFHIINGLTNQSWFFHSPLQYWSGSAENIAADQDIVSTVNERKTQSTSVNVTLRHSIVFSGKRFEERRLVAADALVVTLIHLRDSPVGRQWTRKAEALASQHSEKWHIIPPDGRATSSQLYEFQFRPMSSSDWALLTAAYLFALLYLLRWLSKMHIVKSRLGLMVAMLTQIAASIVSSFTLCAIFKIDLSRIPYYAYPAVILTISMENSIRLIHAVITTSSPISNSDRIGEAFGATAHMAVANRVQNFLVLLGLSRITYPGVAALCAFAAIASLFDFFYLATFFLPVLSVDVRQRELSELEDASQKRNQASQKQQPKQPWLGTVSRIRLSETAASTRIAGTIVLIGFVLIAQAHYAPEGRGRWLNQLFAFSWRNDKPTPKPSLLIDIHQARSPTSWLRLQDHETAREVINVVKPWARSYVARVYDPLIFVMTGADRIPHTKEPLFLPALYDFFLHGIPQFVISLLTVLAALRLFTSYLVRGERQDGPGPEHPDHEGLLSVRSLRKGHTLDVAMMAASPGAQLVSVGLDRAIQVWDVPSGSRSLVLSDPEVPLENPFPVLSMAIDDESKWLALVSWQRVFVWGIEERRWVTTRDIDLGPHKAQAVFFSTKTPGSLPILVIVRRNGTGLEMQLESEDCRDFAICKTPLVWAVAFTEKCHAQQHTPPKSILTASRKNCIHFVRLQGSEWLSREVKLERLDARDIHCLLPIPALSMYLVGRSQFVDLVDIDSDAIIHTFQTETMKPRTLKYMCPMRTQQSGLTSLTLSYVSSETGDLVIHTYLPQSEGDAICPYSPIEPRGNARRQWGQTQEIKKNVPDPGVWEALPSGSIVGVRKRRHNQRTTLPSPSSSTTPNGLRRRAGSRAGSRAENYAASAMAQSWEAWVIKFLPGAKSDFETRALDVHDSSGEDQLQQHDTLDHLMISEVGPMVRLSALSVAVGFGNVVKIISVGHEYFDKARDELGQIGPEGMLNLAGNRRKKVSAMPGRAASATAPASRFD
ncbi:Sterol regulatory element-binding protein cleavage-activating protein [Madurella mycetomatis]|uniref:Sterol regulatory element-binding protein cleavage-activating protein n=1 Tax=Madurella mycetomatis TaxID=100816 RepID=A0A175W665_9PEZI|nr:Sterol regulatory element-binding protein cleavage-activating protein [Madurella mycetomatis]